VGRVDAKTLENRRKDLYLSFHHKDELDDDAKHNEVFRSL